LATPWVNAQSLGPIAKGAKQNFLSLPSSWISVAAAPLEGKLEIGATPISNSPGTVPTACSPMHPILIPLLLDQIQTTRLTTTHRLEKLLPYGILENETTRKLHPEMKL